MQIRPDGTAIETPWSVADLLGFDLTDDAMDAATTVVRLHGEVDHSNAWWVGAIVEGAVLSGARTVRLDLGDLRFADSSLVHVLDRCTAAMRVGGVRVRAAHPVPCVARVFRLLGAEHHLAD